MYFSNLVIDEEDHWCIWRKNRFPKIDSSTPANAGSHGHVWPFKNALDQQIKVIKQNLGESFANKIFIPNCNTLRYRRKSFISYAILYCNGIIFKNDWTTKFLKNLLTNHLISIYKEQWKYRLEVLWITFSCLVWCPY